MSFEIEKSKCAGCGACLRACPYGAIKMGADGKAFIDQKKCKKCGDCKDICPFNAIKEISDDKIKEKTKVTEESKKTPLSFSNSQKPSEEEETKMFNINPNQSIGRNVGQGVNRGLGVGTDRGVGRGLGRGMGRGLGRGPRDGRGGGRGGGGRRFL